ncbi:hypothetical protein HUW63_30150 [Myxococcus sp. AM001]|uniref:hypothetical protein n=1 Tax=Myxococcus vastator TaxID=2709664 RepID=UPI0013D24BDC|nr:hypothetical protein [Myxococcus vastator]NVJ09477.1 hypothetical protein [Myxococcus sp. AM001]
MTAWDLGAEQEVPLVGHPIAELMDGFQGVGRWFRLGRFALSDLLRYSGLESSDSAFWRQCGFIVCVPGLDPERFAFPPEDARLLPRRFLQSARLPIPGANVSFVDEGPLGPLIALQQIRKKLDEGTWQRAIVLAVDSLVDASSLRWLKAARRLKTPERPTGLMPGEAGACLLVEAPRGGLAGDTVWITGCAADRSQGAKASAVQRGMTLSRVIQEALGGTVGVGDVLGNHNGEVARATAWGTARTNLAAERLAVHHRESWPAISLGDVGVPGAIVAISMAARAFARGYARGDASLVWSIGDDGAAGSCVVQRAISRSV